MATDDGAGGIALLVIHTERLAECRDWYRSIGLPLVRERHGSGPEHYAAVLSPTTVVEFYPAGARPPTGRLRLGLVLPAAGALPVGRHLLTDPDGRTVDLTVVPGAP